MRPLLCHLSYTAMLMFLKVLTISAKNVKE